MRLWTLAMSLGIGLALMVAPAQAQWKGYISHPMGFAFAAPGPMTIEKGTYSGTVAGKHDTVIYKFVDDNIEYRAIVIEVGIEKAKDFATVLGEAQYLFQADKNMLMDAFGRVDRQYGRKLTIDSPNNGGRTTGAFYFVNGRILSLQATVLPANGDYETPEMGRFVDSLTFFTVRAADDAIELPPPPK